MFKKLKDVMKAKAPEKPTPFRTLMTLITQMPYLCNMLRPDAKGKSARFERFRMRRMGIRPKHIRLMTLAQSNRMADRIRMIRQASSKKHRPTYWEAGKMARAMPA